MQIVDGDVLEGEVFRLETVCVDGGFIYKARRLNQSSGFFSGGGGWGRGAEQRQLYKRQLAQLGLQREGEKLIWQCFQSRRFQNYDKTFAIFDFQLEWEGGGWVKGKNFCLNLFRLRDCNIYKSLILDQIKQNYYFFQSLRLSQSCLWKNHLELITKAILTKQRHHNWSCLINKLRENWVKLLKNSKTNNFCFRSSRLVKMVSTHMISLTKVYFRLRYASWSDEPVCAVMWISEKGKIATIKLDDKSP